MRVAVIFPKKSQLNKLILNKYGLNCPTGLRGRNSDNKLYHENIGWEFSMPLLEGMQQTYSWISEQVNSKLN